MKFDRPTDAEIAVMVEENRLLTEVLTTARMLLLAGIKVGQEELPIEAHLSAYGALNLACRAHYDWKTERLKRRYPAMPTLAEVTDIEAALQRYRQAQADVVMPMIGPLLDAWEQSFDLADTARELNNWLKKISTAMDDENTVVSEEYP